MLIPAWIDASMAADVAGETHVLSAGITPLRDGQRVAGTVLTAATRRDDNRLVRELIAAGHVADHPILLIAGARDSRTALVGDMTAAELADLGFAGLVTDGLVRKSERIAATALQVWARGRTVLSGTKEYKGSVGSPVSIAGVEVATGDVLVADGDGIVIWPAVRVEDYLASAIERHEKDAARLAR